MWHAKKHGRKSSELDVDGKPLDDSPVYKVGDEIDVSEATARHFINKDVAEEMTTKARAAREVQKPQDKPADELKPAGR